MTLGNADCRCGQRLNWSLAVAAFLVALAFGAECAAGTTNWVRQSPLPFPPESSAQQIAFAPNSGRGYIAGGGLQETTDGGVTWHGRSLGPGDVFINAAYFFDDSYGWLVGNSGYRTTDGGVTWQPMPNLPAGSFYEVDFASPLVGWANSNGGPWRTIDGGLHWLDMGMGISQGYHVNDIDFVSPQIGLLTATVISTGAPGIWRSTNGGLSWAQVWTGAAIPSSIVWIDANTVVVDATFGTAMLRSTDGGLTFEPVASPVTSLENPFSLGGSVLIASASDVYGTGTFEPLTQTADFYRSTDGGLTWTNVFTSDMWGWVYAAGARSPNGTGFIVGLKNLILETHDEGLTWGYQSSGCLEQFEDIEMLDDLRGAACGWNGVVVVTNDGGQSWLPANVGYTLSHGDNFYNITTVPPNFICAAGLFGTMIKSLDGGQTWEGVTIPGSGYGDIWAVEFVSPLKGWIDVGTFMFATTDGGLTWTQQFNGAALPNYYVQVVYDIHFIDEQRGWGAAANAPLVLRTTNGGQSWQYSVAAPGKILRQVDFVNPSVGWVVGYDGSTGLSYIAKSTNGGLTWQTQAVPVTNPPLVNLLSLDAVSTTEAWAADINGHLLHTTNGGSTWNLVPTGFEGPPGLAAGYQAIHARANGAVWAAGDWGTIIHLPSPVAADLNQDGHVNAADLALMLGAWGTAAGDLTGDGITDASDLALLLGAWS